MTLTQSDRLENNTKLGTKLETDTIETPIGKVIIVVQGEQLCALDFADCRTRMMTLLAKRFDPVTLVETPNPAGIAEQVRRYFAGDLTALETIPTLTGGTDFQQQVWQGLRQIEAGAVMTYGELAKVMDNPKAVRAVGMANSLNPIAIAIPCHRVIGANGKLTGYAGGLSRKRWLLAHEGTVQPGKRHKTDTHVRVGNLCDQTKPGDQTKPDAPETAHQLSVFS